MLGWRSLNCAVVAVLLIRLGSSVGQADDSIDFDREVASLLVRRCVECHKGTAPSGELNLTSHDGMTRGGDSGAAIKPGDAQQSLLLERVLAGEMPPPQQGRSQRLPDVEIAVLRRWIESGAKWPEGRQLDLYERTSDVRGGRDWWSLQPVRRPEVPQVANQSRVQNPIDAFVLAQLEQEKMEPAPLADRRVLLRRLYNDLIGLPPSFEQVQAFVADQSPDAWSRRVDELLDSPHYGERWARYWLDLVRFAETSGYERDQEKPFAWKYRDWVVDALNSDMPYDQFVIEQLAGDEIPERSARSVIATGFLRLGTWNDEPNDNEDYKYDRLEDLVHVTSSAFLGLTVKCARCHDHKFDPIPQVDYYRIAAAFWPGSIGARDRALLGGPSADELGVADTLGWTDLTSSPPPLHVLKNGDRRQPLEVAEPGPLSLVPTMFATFEPPVEGAKTTGRRLALASWITDRNNPLTPRVLVNRIWQHHFGHGLVRTPNNFGFNGELPTHPELLDWLATELVAGDWKLKRLHRLILNSSTWQQSSLHPKFDEYSQQDFLNRFLWRSERRRLDAEALRDAMLAATGELKLQKGGPSFKPTIAAEAIEGLSRKAAAWSASPPDEQLRRTLYMYSKRHLIAPMMTAFDFADTTLPCGRRNVTTVAPQALTLINNQFPHARSQSLARRLFSETSETSSSSDNSNPDPRQSQRRMIEAVWQRVLSRRPTTDESLLAAAHLASQLERFRNPPPADVRPEHWRRPDQKIVRDGLTLHLRADLGIELDNNRRVLRWLDQSGAGHHASQSIELQRPELVPTVLNGRPALSFDGRRRFLSVVGDVLTTADCTIFAVATDTGPNGHRAILSNWSGRDGNSTSSIFLGLTAERTVRFSDNFGSAGSVENRSQPFILTAVNGAASVAVYQNATELAARSSNLSARKLSTPWVIGQQGNIDGEYWHGAIAELLVYDRELSVSERQAVWSVLLDRYQLPTTINRVESSSPSPEVLALASLCHVLLNSNEFIYVD